MRVSPLVDPGDGRAGDQHGEQEEIGFMVSQSSGGQVQLPARGLSLSRIIAEVGRKPASDQHLIYANVVLQDLAPEVPS